MGGIRRLAAICAAIALLAAATPATAAVDGPGSVEVTGYPRCTIAGGVNGYVWWDSDGRSRGVSPTRFIAIDGRVRLAISANCTSASACLAKAPEFSGRAATVVGTAAADHLVGTPGRDLILGRGGDDTIEGGPGRDLVCAGRGADDVDGGGWRDVVLGGEGDDILRGGVGSDLIDGGPGNDAVFGDEGDDELFGSGGEDGVYGGRGADSLDGGSRSDACFGQDGADDLTGCEVAGQGDVEYGSGTFRTFSVTVDSAVGLPAELVAAQVDRILGDSRSWIGDGSRGWRRVDGGGQLRIILATPAQVDALCAPIRTGGFFSCRNGGVVALNSDRWLNATTWWPTSLDVYRTYLVNHEVGHFLGRGHVPCPRQGALAPVMMQQTKGLDGCVANGWVHP